MKLTNAQIFDLACSLEGLMEQTLPVKLAFQISQIFLSLESLRRSIALVIEKLPKGENGVPEEEPFTELLAIENEVAIEPIDSIELFKALDIMTPRQAMALVPILKGGGQ